MRTKKLALLFIAFISLVSISFHDSSAIPDHRPLHNTDIDSHDKHQKNPLKDIVNKIPTFIANHKKKLIVAGAFIGGFVFLRIGRSYSRKHGYNNLLRQERQLPPWQGE